LISPTIIRWLPLVAVALHLIEEFLWPGGFADWYRWYRPERAVSVTTGFLVRINALLVLLARAPGVNGFTTYGVALWLVVASIAAANGAFHIWATVARGRYSPGVITGTIVYLPLAAFGFWYFWQHGLARPEVMAQAAIVGPAYNVYAAWNHRRRARKAAAAPPTTAR
jgi:hypothetical protein